MENLLVLLVLLILAGCATPTPDPAVVAQQVEETVSSIPTQTAYPTYTPNSTYKPEPTLTAVVITKVVTATFTLTPSNTPTSTATLTPVYTATKTLPPTATQNSWQKTNTAYKETQTYYGTFNAVNSKDFITYPDKYYNIKVKVGCRIFNVVDRESVQCYIPGTYDAFYVEMKDSFDDLYEDNRITIYGTGTIEKCFTNTMGNQVCQSLIKNAFFTKP